MRTHRRLLSQLLAAGAIALGGLTAPAASHASAGGYQYWGGFTANIGGQSVGIPAGQLYHYISGSGYHISWEAANFGSVGNLCDPSIRFTYGNGSYRYDGNVHWGCSHIGQWKYAFNWKAPRGSACAQLWVANWRRMITKQCHYIYG
jgi:hypothetical protein